jgi:mannose-6-phosphate isomerase
MLYPLTFQPIFKERVWGGRRIAKLYNKPLPANVPIGESWEISDRPGDASILTNGPLAGKDLRWLVENHADQIFGESQPHPTVFPWLIKILDAQDKLSLQVHPPAKIAAELGGEPKTEMWYVAAAKPGADIFVGLKDGVTRAEFERKTTDGTVADCFHRIEVKPGDCMFLRSGRVHALGAGSVIFEIQQNSDTTYRVFDWNRVGLDGKPRDLHIENSMRSIDFDDFEPTMISTRFEPAEFGALRRLARDPLFTVDAVRTSAGKTTPLHGRELQVIASLSGRLQVIWEGTILELAPGGFALVPACLTEVRVFAETDSEWLWVQPGAKR